MHHSTRWAAIVVCAVALVAAAAAPAFAGNATITYSNCTFSATTTGGPPPTSMTALASGSSASCGHPDLTGSLDSDITYTFDPIDDTAAESSFRITLTFHLSETVLVCHYTVEATELRLASAGPPTWTYSGDADPRLDATTSDGSCPINPPKETTVTLTP